MSRKRSFDIDDAINIAMREFWLNGYDGTSISDLCNLIGIERPSLYRAFNSKDKLFQRVLERYEQLHLQFVPHALSAATIYDVASLLLQGLIQTVTQPQMPHGALDLNAGIICGPECETVRENVIAWRNTYEKALDKRFMQAKYNGDLKNGISPQAITQYVMSVCTGIALQAKAGASRSMLRGTAEIALLAIEQVCSAPRVNPAGAVATVEGA